MGTTVIKKFQPNEVIIREGERDEHIYKIFSGSVDLYMHYGKVNECRIGSLNASEYFGACSFLREGFSLYTAVAREAVSLLSVPNDNFEEYIKRNHQHAIQIMKSMEKVHRLVYEFAYELSEINKVDALIAVNRVADRHVHQNEVRKVPTAEEIRQVLAERMEEKNALAVEQIHSEQPENQLNELRNEDGLRIGIDVLPENMEEVNKLYLSTHKRYPRIVHPEYKAFLFEKEYTCPACEKTFMGEHIFYSKLVGASKPEFARYDLRAFYRDFEAEWYEIVTCPHCYFSTLASIFTESKFEGEKYHYGSRVKASKYEETLARAYMEMDLDFDTERDLNFVITQHYMGLVCAYGFWEHRQIFAHIWTNLSWLYRSIGDDELAQQAEIRAKDAYIDVYMNCRLSAKQEQVVCLHIANILYREGKWHEARRWVNNVWADREMRSTVYANLGRQLLEDIKEKIEEEKLEQERLEEERLEQERLQQEQGKK